MCRVMLVAGERLAPAAFIAASRPSDERMAWALALSSMQKFRSSKMGIFLGRTSVQRDSSGIFIGLVEHTTIGLQVR